MSASFDPEHGLVVARTQVTGPAGIAILRLAVDTGATRSVINSSLLVAVGYDPATAEERTEVTTGSGVEFAAKVSIDEILALEQRRVDFPVLAHTLPPSAGVDGVLGLDFFRGLILTIDFHEGRVTVTEPSDARKPPA